MSLNDKLLVIGIEGLDHMILDSRIRLRRLPSLAMLAAGGALRPLNTSGLGSALAAWGSLATGVGPQIHGYLLDQEVGPVGIQPATRASWAIAPIWEMLGDAGFPTTSICWPGLFPGAAWNGLHIDRRFCMPSGLSHEDWPLPLDVAPAAIRPALREVRVHPADIPIDAVRPLVAIADPLPATLAATLRRALARLATLHAGAELAIGTDARCVFVYCDWLTAAADALGVAVADLPDAAWTLLDQAVAGWMKLGSPGRQSLVVSLGARQGGFLLASGGNIVSLMLDRPPAILSFAPMICEYFGLSKQGVEQDDRAVADAVDLDPQTKDLARLAAFGFVPPPIDRAIDDRRRIALAAFLLESDPARSLELAQAVDASGPSALTALGIEASARVALGDRAALLEIAERIGAIDQDHAWRSLALGAYHAMAQDVVGATPHLRKAAAAGSIDDQVRAGALWMMVDRPGAAASAFRKIIESSPNHLGALVGLASTGQVRGREAEAVLRRILALEPGHDAAQAALDQLLASLGRHGEVVARRPNPDQ